MIADTIAALVGKPVALTLNQWGLTPCGACERDREEDFEDAERFFQRKKHVRAGEDVGHVGIIVKSPVAEYPFRVVCEACGRHQGWFTSTDIPRLMEQADVVRDPAARRKRKTA